MVGFFQNPLPAASHFPFYYLRYPRQEQPALHAFLLQENLQKSPRPRHT